LRKIGPNLLRQCERSHPHISGESLIADEWRIAYDGIEPLMCLFRPGKEIGFVNKGSRRPLPSSCRMFAVYLDSHRIRMANQEFSISAGRIKNTIIPSPYRPPHQSLCDIFGGKILAESLRVCHASPIIEGEKVKLSIPNLVGRCIFEPSVCPSVALSVHYGAPAVYVPLEQAIFRATPILCHGIDVESWRDRTASTPL
jgi:hypothetical protein